MLRNTDDDKTRRAKNKINTYVREGKRVEYHGRDNEWQGVDLSFYVLGNILEKYERNDGRDKLVGANFSQANLQSAKFRARDLEGANFNNAILRYADFTDATLVQASFESTEQLEVNFRKATLTKTNFKKADLRKANMSKADLVDAVLSAADLSFANLHLASMLRVDLSKSSLQSANLSGANLSNAKLLFTNFKNANIQSVNFQGASFFPDSDQLNRDSLLRCLNHYEELYIDHKFEKTDKNLKTLRQVMRDDLIEKIKNVPLGFIKEIDEIFATAYDHPFFKNHRHGKQNKLALTESQKIIGEARREFIDRHHDRFEFFGQKDLAATLGDDLDRLFAEYTKQKNLGQMKHLIVADFIKKLDAQDPKESTAEQLAILENTLRHPLFATHRNTASAFFNRVGSLCGGNAIYTASQKMIAAEIKRIELAVAVQLKR